MTRLFILVCLCASALGAPKSKKISSNDGKIVGGSDTNISEVPYQVSLQYRNRHICGGSILDSRHVLTAAHCVHGMNSQVMSVRAGSSLHSSGGEVHRVRRATVHPNYREATSDNDIAMLELATPITPSSGARAVQLARSEPRPGERALVSGWGATREGGGASRTLKSVSVPTISRESCQRMYMRFNTVTENMWCAGYHEGKRDACQGDSGGPAVVNGRLAGVVSWGAGCARRASPGVYANVARYQDWIAEQTGGTRKSSSTKSKSKS
ncbi:UNVERIFIED_CONTAM: hypothetical protein PYX00_009821 [Menopon gallinae]|uniref:Peptidase S1 domain-containing protein n=1 Tax=Menopon gallinae TaxID=328185 RepID=A0AAW2HCS1_9NEOP